MAAMNRIKQYKYFWLKFLLGQSEWNLDATFDYSELSADYYNAQLPIHFVYVKSNDCSLVSSYSFIFDSKLSTKTSLNLLRLFLPRSYLA